MSGFDRKLLASRSFDAGQELMLRTLLSLCAARLLVAGPKENTASTCLQSLLDSVQQNFSATFLVRQTPGICSERDLMLLIKTLYQLPAEALTPLMAELYEQLVDQTSVRKHGVFYTPADLARRMIVEVFSSAGAVTPRSIADISNGSGIFLLEALRALQQKADSARSLASLYGIDRDSNALECSRMLLQLESLRHGVPLAQSAPIVNANIRAGNSLVNPELLTQSERESRTETDSICFARTFPDVFSRQGGFDLIVGNPPYGLSRDSRISSDDTVLLKRLYRDRIGGRVNTYLLFILRAFELLAPKGTLSLVVPNAWLGIDEAQRVRELLLAQGSLCSINFYTQSPFKSLGVEVITFIAHKSRITDSIAVRTFESITSATPTVDASLKTSEICSDPSKRIPLRAVPEERRLLASIERNCLALGSAESSFRASIALQAYARGRGNPPQDSEVVRSHPFHLDYNSGPECIPYLRGQDVSRLQIDWQGEFLRFGPWLAEHHPRERYSTPRILVREILASAPRLIQAVYTDQPFSYNRSILHIHSMQEGTFESLKALALLLNSTLAGFWLQQRGRKAQRALFPKILARDLNEFPLPHGFSQSCRALAELHARMADGREPVAGNLLLEIDQLVYRLYQLNSQESSFLEGLNSVAGKQGDSGTDKHNRTCHQTAQEVPFPEKHAATNN